MILVSLEDGAAGGAALVEWARSAADDRWSKLPQFHPYSTLEAAVRKNEASSIFSIVVKRDYSWTDIFDSFLSHNEHVPLVGLFVKDRVPHVGLFNSIYSHRRHSRCRRRRHCRSTRRRRRCSNSHRHGRRRRRDNNFLHSAPPGSWAHVVQDRRRQHAKGADKRGDRAQSRQAYGA